MQAWYLCENPYPLIPQEVLDRVEPPIPMGRCGFMTHAEAKKGIRMFAREVLPRLKEVVHRDPH